MLGVNTILKNVFGTKNDRTLRRILPIVDVVNQFEEEYRSLSNEELKAKTRAFRERLKKGETLNDLLPEAFAAVKNACRRLMGQTWEVCEQPNTWEMIPFDVQIIGGVVLHRGIIAEMSTGEGKTLVATFPLYLNALAGKGAHLVTVNDYLAQRDSQWMGKVFESLGLTVGCLQNDMSPADRKIQYDCDITYGTNSEFGFDYLRDNGMATHPEEQVQRGHFFAIIDEVDSILIDEARTPLIISGPAAVSSHRYDKLKPIVSDLFHKQTILSNRLLKEAKELLDKKEDLEATGRKLYQVLLGTPKQKQLAKMMEEPDIRKLMDRTQLSYMGEMKGREFNDLKEELYFSIEEKTQEVTLSEKGRDLLNPEDRDEFILPDIMEKIEKVDQDESLSTDAKEEAKKNLQKDFEGTSEKIHNLTQLLRAFALFEKDVDYVVTDNKVMIVDEFTGRLMPGRRYSDGLHQALEAKEGVKIERETQTYATITIQNYFRLYEKLSGMTGTAETEANEFLDIYKLDVIVIPTNEGVHRIDHNDVIYKTRREKFNAVVEEIAKLNEEKRPVLVGTVSVDSSEVLSRLLKRRGVPHSVLNAKYHQQEAEIVSFAGQPGRVTIATNMAGRGTDIKLGEGVVGCKRCDLNENKGEKNFGLHIIGTERHESRRIDRQLRGRCARQGDPGSSRFYISLEDDLMRLFGSDRIANVMGRIGIEEGQELAHPLLNRSIETAQKRVEERNFSIRKHTLKYDDVMNKQRQVIYEFRNEVINTENPHELFEEVLEEVLENKVEEFCPKNIHSDEWNLEGLTHWISQNFPLRIKMEELTEKGLDTEQIFQKIKEAIQIGYELKKEIEGEESMRTIERYGMLSVIDRLWREHLYSMDALREGIMLRAYGQSDPLIAYKKEAFDTFSEMMHNMKDEIPKVVFSSTLSPEKLQEFFRLSRMPQQYSHQEVSAFQLERQTRPQQGPGESAGAPQQRQAREPIAPIRRDMPKVGRNDPCPCGSGKKFKKCCGK